MSEQVQPTEDQMQIDIDRGYNVQMQNRDDSLIKHVLCNDPLTNKFIAQMLGQMYDEKENKIYSLNPSVQAKRVMNDYGITRWAGFISTITDKNVLRSNMTTEQAAEFSFQELVSVADDVLQNADEYDLDNQNLDFFCLTLFSLIFPTMTRPVGGIERKVTNPTASSIEHVMRRDSGMQQSQIPQQNQSFFGGMRR